MGETELEPYEAMELPEIVDAVMIRRWPSGFSASVSIEGMPSIVSKQRWPTWQEAMADALLQMTGRDFVEKVTSALAHQEAGEEPT